MPIRFQRKLLLLSLSGIVVYSAAGLETPVFAQTPAAPAASTQSPARTPTETAKYFYQSLVQKKFREALSVSVFKGAIDGLSEGDFEELRPEFEALSATADALEYTGEEITADHATVFTRIKDDNGDPQVSPIPFRLRNGIWILGDDETLAAVQKDGKNYFFNIRIQNHEDDAKEMFKRIVKAQIVHAAKNNGSFGDLRTLVAEELLPQDILGTQSTGYKYSVTLAADRKTYTAAAEPERYGRSGRLSFYLENSVLSSKDNGGKPLKN